MKKRTRNGLIITGAILAAGLTTYFLFFHKNTKKPKGDKGNKGNVGDGSDSTPAPDSSVGKVASVKDQSANIREGSCTDTDIVVTATGTNTTIGNVIKSQIGCQDGSGQFKWYYVSLTKDLRDDSGYWGSLSEHSHGWVREDIVNLQ